MATRLRDSRLSAMALGRRRDGRPGCSARLRSPSPHHPAAGRSSRPPLPGEVCTYDKYNGGVPQITDLTAATIGFAQSEKENNPFRSAETQSIKDEAAKLGITNLS